MRVSQHSGRQGSAKHNDRNFDLRKAPHIDEARTGNNVVGSLRGLKGATLEEQELDYYQRVYGAGIDARNKRYLAQRHPERCKTPEAYYRGSKTRPEEMILQIGSHVDGSATPEQLRTCLQEYLAELNEYSDRFRGLIDAAFTPGIHDALMHSSDLARAAGVKEEELLTSIEDVDDFFLN